MIRLFDPRVNDSSINYVNEVLKSSQINQGKVVEQFETLLGKFINNELVFTVNSGTSALHLALILAGVKPGSEVILPAQTFIATGLAVLYCGATPVFEDINPYTGNMEFSKLGYRINNRTSAIILVDWAGYPGEIEEISQLCKRRNIPLIIDAAHSFGATYQGNRIGNANFADFTIFSFQTTKSVTTGDGGAIACRSFDAFVKGKKLRWFGISRDNDLPDELGERVYNLSEIGYKYNMNDISASIGIGQLETLDNRLKRRRQIADEYFKAFQNVPDLKLMRYSRDRESSYWLFPIRVERRDKFISKLKENNIEASVVHLGIDKNSIFGGKKMGLSGQRLFDETQVHIPVHENLTDEDVFKIIDTIREGW